MGLNHSEKAIAQAELQEYEQLLRYTQSRAEYSLQMEGVVGEKFKSSQKDMTNRLFERVAEIRRRIDSLKINLNQN